MARVSKKGEFYLVTHYINWLDAHASASQHITQITPNGEFMSCFGFHSFNKKASMLEDDELANNKLPYFYEKVINKVREDINKYAFTEIDEISRLIQYKDDKNEPKGKIVKRKGGSAKILVKLRTANEKLTAKVNIISKAQAFLKYLLGENPNKNHLL
jgi:hypothetical protein